MSKSERGFSPLIILIVATVALVVILGGNFLWQQIRSQSIAPQTSPVDSEPNITATSDSNSDSTPSSSPSPSSNSTLNSSPLTISTVTQPDCTSTSCAITSVLIITGSGFSDKTQLSATGQTNGNPYTGSITELGRDNDQVIFDLLNLPCQTYIATLTNPMPSGSSATFTFSPKKCN